MADSEEIGRLRALGALLREEGWTRLSLRDGTVIERPPPSPLEQAAAAARSSSLSSDDDDDDEVATEERAERELEGRWRSYWERVTASSGAPVPSFPGPEQAMRFLGSRPA